MASNEPLCCDNRIWSHSGLESIAFDLKGILSFSVQTCNSMLQSVKKSDIIQEKA